MGFKPLHETHAIERVSFALGIEREATESELQLLADSYKELGHDFGRAEMLQGFELNVRPDISSGKPTPQINRPTIGGVSLKTFRRDGNVEWELATGKAIDAATIITNCHNYTRWGAVWGKAQAILSATLKKLNSPGITWAGLEYVDVFIWQGEEKDWQAAQLFKMESGLIAPAIVDKGPVWHTHLGWFTRESLAEPGHRLNILNINGVRHEGQLRVVVHSRMKHHFNRIHSAEEAADKTSGVYRSMEQMHDEDKALLDRLLTSEATNAMYLHVGEDT